MPSTKTPRYKYTPPKAEMRATRESPVLGGISSGLSTLREWLDKVGDAKYQRPPGVLGFGEMTVGTAPEEVGEWARGNSPFSQEPNYGNILDPRIKPGREQGLLDVATLVPEAAGLGVAGLRRGARAAYPALNPEMDMSRREFLGNTGKVAAGAAAASVVPDVLRGADNAAPVATRTAQAAVKPIQKMTIEELSEEMFAKGIKSAEQQKAYMLSHIDAGKVAPVRMRDKKILSRIFDPAEIGEFVPLKNVPPADFSPSVTGGSNAKDVIDFPISNVRRSNGAIGTQGVTEPQIYDVLTHAAGMKLNPSMSMREMVEAFKSNPAAQQKLRDFTKANPIEVSPLPDGSFHLRDGHHRTFLLNQIGDLTVPALQSAAKAAGGSTTLPNNYRAGGRVRMI